LYLLFFPKGLTADIERMQEYLTTRLLKAAITAEILHQDLQSYLGTCFQLNVEIKAAQTL